MDQTTKIVKKTVKNIEELVTSLKNKLKPCKKNNIIYKVSIMSCKQKYEDRC